MKVKTSIKAICAVATGIAAQRSLTTKAAPRRRAMKPLTRSMNRELCLLIILAAGCNSAQRDLDDYCRIFMRRYHHRFADFTAADTEWRQRRRSATAQRIVHEMAVGTPSDRRAVVGKQTKAAGLVFTCEPLMRVVDRVLPPSTGTPLPTGAGIPLERCIFLLQNETASSTIPAGGTPC
jgi:hypothetical protein